MLKRIDTLSMLSLDIRVSKIEHFTFFWHNPVDTNIIRYKTETMDTCKKFKKTMLFSGLDAVLGHGGHSLRKNLIGPVVSF